MALPPAISEWASLRYLAATNSYIFNAKGKNSGATGSGQRENVMCLLGGRTGKAYVRDWNTFLVAMAEDVRNKRPIFFTEVERDPTRSRRFALDIDFQNEGEPVPDELLIQYMITIQNMMTKYFPHGRLHAIVSSPKDMKTVQRDGLLYYCTNLHVVWPEVIVDMDQSLQLRHHIVNRLQTQFGDRSGNCWEDAVDEGIYTSGLRFEMNNKAEKCGDCKKNPQSATCITCGHCRLNGHVDKGRPYFPKWWLESSGYPNEDKLSELWAGGPLHMLKMTCLHVADDVKIRQDYRVPEGAAIKPDKVSRKSKGHKAKTPRAAGEIDRFKEDTRRKSKSAVPMDLRSDNMKYLIDYLKSPSCQLPHWYKDIRIVKIQYDATKRFYTLDCDGEGSHYCQNKCGDHYSNHVYFVITKAGIRQHCLSKKKELKEPMTKLCRDYRGPCIPIDRDIINRLFQDSDGPLSMGGRPLTADERREESIKSSNQIIHTEEQKERQALLKARKLKAQLSQKQRPPGAEEIVSTEKQREMDRPLVTQVQSQPYRQPAVDFLLD